MRFARLPSTARWYRPFFNTMQMVRAIGARAERVANGGVTISIKLFQCAISSDAYSAEAAVIEISSARREKDSVLVNVIFVRFFRAFARARGERTGESRATNMVNARLQIVGCATFC